MPLRNLAVLLLVAAVAPAQQYRAFWADAFHYGFKNPAQVDQLLDDLTAAKANAVFAEIRSRGDSYYLNSVEPPAEDPEYAPSFDALQYLIDQGHARGIEVHAWLPVMPLWTAAQPPPNPGHLWYKHGPNAEGSDMWMTIDSQGHTGTSLDPGHPDAFQYLADLIANLAANYAVDGIHLDYIRYPETAAFGYNPVALERFSRLYGRTGLPAPFDPEFSEFRRAQVTALVRQVYLRTFAVKPLVKISAALITWGNGPLDDDQYRAKDAYSRVFQDWRGWLEEGILDLGIPMNYFREQQYPGYLDRWMQYEKDRQYNRMTLIGLAAYLNSIPESLAQLDRALAPSSTGAFAAGVNFYSYASTNTLAPNAMFYAAAGDRFGDAVPVPDLPWKSNPQSGHVYGWIHVDDGAAWRRDGLAVIIESDTGASTSRQVTTDATGFFGAVDLPPDRYRVRLLNPALTLAPQDVAPGSAARFDAYFHESDFGAEPSRKSGASTR